MRSRPAGLRLSASHGLTPIDRIRLVDRVDRMSAASCRQRLLRIADAAGLRYHEGTNCCLAGYRGLAFRHRAGFRFQHLVAAVDRIDDQEHVERRDSAITRGVKVEAIRRGRGEEVVQLP